MPSSRRALLLAALALCLPGCTQTTEEIPDQLSQLRVTIEAEHYTCLTGSSNLTRRSIRAVLANAEGAGIERGDVGIEVNGVAMRFRVSRGNYYDRHPYYLLDDDDRLPIEPGADYRFVLVLPGGTRHDIGTLRMPAALSADQFDFPKKPPAAGPVSIGWRDLAEPVELRLGRSEVRHEADGRIVVEGAGPYDPEAIRRTIGPGASRPRSGRWEVPEKLLVSTPERKLLTLYAEALARSEGRVAKNFSKQSRMTAVRRIELDMEFAKVD